MPSLRVGTGEMISSFCSIGGYDPRSLLRDRRRRPHRRPGSSRGGGRTAPSPKTGSGPRPASARASSSTLAARLARRCSWPTSPRSARASRLTPPPSSGGEWRWRIGAIGSCRAGSALRRAGRAGRSPRPAPAWPPFASGVCSGYRARANGPAFGQLPLEGVVDEGIDFGGAMIDLAPGLAGSGER